MEPGGLWDADLVTVKAEIRHNAALIAEKEMVFGGQTSVFETHFQIGMIKKDYEVLEVRVTAAQANATNFGFHQRTFKLIP